jgi:adenosine deaminase
LGEDIRILISELPKVEQHIHIVGSIRPSTLLWLLSDSNIEQAGLWNLEKVQRLFQYQNFSHFIECYSLVTRSIRKEKQFERIVYEMLEDEAKQNVKYVEASFSLLIIPDSAWTTLEHSRP